MIYYLICIKYRNQEYYRSDVYGSLCFYNPNYSRKVMFKICKSKDDAKENIYELLEFIKIKKENYLNFRILIKESVNFSKLIKVNDDDFYIKEISKQDFENEQLIHNIIT